MNAKEFCRKHKNKIRIALFALFAVAAVFFITNGVVSIGHKDPGYYAVDVLPEAKVTVYDAGIHFMLYAQGGSDEIKRQLNEASAAYSRSLERYYKLLDAEREYEGYVNLATLNAHPGEMFEISEELFFVLRDALEKTGENRGFSLFDGALYTEWRALRYLENPVEFDPLNDPEAAERLRRISETARQSGYCSLRVIDADKRVVSFDLSPQARAFLDEEEIAAPSMHLNLLRDAYLLQLVAADMVSEGFDSAYLYADSGISIMLNRDDMLYALYGCVDQKVVKAGELIAPSQTVFCQMAAYPLTDSNYGFYAVSKDGRTRYRHPWIDGQTGECSDLLLSAAVVAEGVSPADTLYQMLSLTQARDENAVKETLGDVENALIAMYSLQTSPETICIREARSNMLQNIESPFRKAAF